MSRSLTNTRFRDFYDVYILQKTDLQFNPNTFVKALLATTEKRGSREVLEKKEQILNDLATSTMMNELWERYRKNNSYASELDWKNVLEAVKRICE